MTLSRTASIALLALAAAPLAGLAADKDSDSQTAMTLYADGMAVVQQTRNETLKAGTQRLAWPLAARPQPGSLALLGQGVRLLGYDQGPGAAAGLDSRIGQSVTIADAPGATPREGRLLAVDGNAARVRVDDRVLRIALDGPAVIGWPAAAASEDANDDALSLQLAADKAGRQAVSLWYQRAAPAWQARYSGVYDAKAQKLRLAATAVIDNTTDQALNADSAWLVAGQAQRVGEAAPQPMMMAAKAQTRAAAPVGPAEAVGGLYRYPLADGLNVPAGATRGVALMPPVSVKATRETRFSHYAMADSGPEREHAQRILHVADVGDQPLPAGAVQVYDSQGQAQLLGADTLDDTPAGAPLTLTLGQAFDITASREVTTGKASNARRVSMTLYNATDQPRRVTIIETLPDGARLSDESPKPAGRDDGAPMWEIQVPAQGQARFAYGFTLAEPAAE